MGVGFWLMFWRWVVVKITEYKHSVRCHGLWGQGLGTGFVVGKVEDDAHATRVRCPQRGCSEFKADCLNRGREVRERGETGFQLADQTCSGEPDHAEGQATVAPMRLSFVISAFLVCLILRQGLTL